MLIQSISCHPLLQCFGFCSYWAIFYVFDWISLYRNLAQRTRCWWPVPLCRTALRNFGIPNNHQLAVYYFCIMLESYIFVHVTISSRVSNHSHVMSCSDFLLRSTGILPFDLYWFYVLARALLHFLDSDKFKSKEQFTEHYKNLSSFDEKEVCCNLWWWWTLVAAMFPWLWTVTCALWRNFEKVIMLVKCYHSYVMSSPIAT